MTDPKPPYEPPSVEELEASGDAISTSPGASIE